MSNPKLPPIDQKEFMKRCATDSRILKRKKRIKDYAARINKEINRVRWQIRREMRVSERKKSLRTMLAEVRAAARRADNERLRIQREAAKITYKPKKGHSHDVNQEQANRPVPDPG